MNIHDLRVIRAAMSNGLRVLVTERPALHRVVVSAHLFVGSRYENDQTNGLSHFLEHMLFRGIPGHSTAHEQALAFERLGTTINAATGNETGTLAMGVPPESLDDALPLFCDVFSRPVFDGVAIEKGIVREEILEDLDEHGKQVDPDTLVQGLAFRDHPLGYPVIGTTKRLDSFDGAMLRRHHERFYRADNTVVSVCGPVDSSRVLSSVERGLAELPPAQRVSVSSPPPQDEARFSFVKNSSSQTELRVGFRAPSEKSDDEPATDLLERLLDDGMATRLYRRICDERGLCYDVSATYSAFADVGLFDLGAETAHERAAEVLGEMLDVVRRLRDDGPSDVELDRAKARHRWRLQEMLDSPEELADATAEAEMFHAGRTLSERREQMDAVTNAEVRAAAERLFRREGLSVVAVGLAPKKHRQRLADLTESFD